MHRVKAESKECNVPSEDEQRELRRGPWTLEEDTLLTHYISRHGEGRWNMVAKYAGKYIALSLSLYIYSIYDI